MIAASIASARGGRSLATSCASTTAARATCRGINEDRAEEIDLTVRVAYQACDDSTRYRPEEAAIPLQLSFLPHDWERV